MQLEQTKHLISQSTVLHTPEIILDNFSMREGHISQNHLEDWDLIIT